jgi:hypothetical protein
MPLASPKSKRGKNQNKFPDGNSLRLQRTHRIKHTKSCLTTAIIRADKINVKSKGRQG